MIATDARPARREGIIAQQAVDDVILLRLDDGQYYALEGVGGRVWELCDGTHSVADMVSLITQEFDVAADVAQADVIELLEDLAGEKLVTTEA